MPFLEHPASAEQAARQVVLPVPLRPLLRPHREVEPRLLAPLPGKVSRRQVRRRHEPRRPVRRGGGQVLGLLVLHQQARGAGRPQLGK